MSRHRGVKKLNYADEYDDYYGAYDEDDDDDFDLGDEGFEAKYLSSGIDLKLCESNNISNKPKQLQPEQDVKDNSILLGPSADEPPVEVIGQRCQTATRTLVTAGAKNDDTTRASNLVSHLVHFETAKDFPIEPVNVQTEHIAAQSATSISSDLTRLAIQHLDKHQWMLPLLEMDQKFRDKTYYKHYSDSYISSLRSKLGHFLADKHLLTNPMRYHAQKELDNYEKYSRMFELLTDYYQSLGGSFFSFATPSPDEEIVIGCRLGTKVKKPPPPKQSAMAKHEQSTARFEYSGKPKQTQSKSDGASQQAKQNSIQSNINPQAKTAVASTSKTKPYDITVQENFTPEQLDKISNKYKETLSGETNKGANTKGSVRFAQMISTSTASQKSTTSSGTTAKQTATSNAEQQKIRPKSTIQTPKQLATLTEKRQTMKRKLKQNAEPTAQDWEAFRVRASQTTQEFSELMKGIRPRVNLVVVGHVDAGKSTLVGHLLYKLGHVTKKQMHRNEVNSQRSGKASFKFAWALDETDEERARGVTIDIALTKFETPQKDVVLLDAPGHVDFIPAVISGAAQADVAILVVDATRGEFETGFQSGGQTREHTFLVRSLGVKSLIVVVNKMDNVDWNWSRFSEIVEQLRPFLKQVGFNLKDDVQFVPASGLTGDNLTERRQDKLLKQSSHPQLETAAMDGGLDLTKLPSLLEAIDQMKQPQRMVDKPTRVCVTDVFKGMSSGVFLGAKVISGKIEPKQKLLLSPPGELCDIKQVEVRDSRSTQSAYAGDIITTTATGVDMSKFYRGCILCDPMIPCQATNRFQARIIMFQNANTILIKGTPIEVHINGAYECGEVRKLISLLNKNTGELIQRKPRCVAQNSSAIIQLKLSRVVCCELYEDNKDLGRFMMRSFGKTIAAGLISKVKPAKLSKSGRSKMKSKS